MLQIWNALKTLLLKHSAERQRPGQGHRDGMNPRQPRYETYYLTLHRCKCHWLYEIRAKGDPAVFNGPEQHQAAVLGWIDC